MEAEVQATYGTWRFRSAVRGCVWPVLGFTWCLTHETDNRKTAAALRERHKQKKKRKHINEKGVKIGRAKRRKNRQKWTSRQNN